MPRRDKSKYIRELKRETRAMKEKFAILVSNTSKRLQEEGKTVEDLRVLLITRNGRILQKELESKSNIPETFITLNGYWSFFKYDILSCIITTFCSNLKLELDEYISSLKRYCKKRICAVPKSGCFCRSKAETEYFQVDRVFESEMMKIKMGQLGLINKLEEILGTTLRISKTIDLSQYSHAFQFRYYLRSRLIWFFHI